MIHDWFIIILDFLLGPIFPPKVKGQHVRDWEDRIAAEAFPVASSIGIPQRKRYRDGIERQFAEERLRARTENPVYVRSREYAVQD